MNLGVVRGSETRLREASVDLSDSYQCVGTSIELMSSALRLAASISPKKHQPWKHGYS